MLEDRYTTATQRKLRKMDIEIAKSIIQKITSMKKAPLPIDAMRCRDKEFRENVFEIIYLKHRILYELDFEDNIILIHKIEENESGYYT